MHIAVLLTIAGVVVALPSMIARVAEREIIDARAGLFLFVGAIVVVVWTMWHATRNA